MHTLDAQMRCVPPPHDVHGRIAVGVVAVSASDALKVSLVLATSGVNGTTGRTGLRRKGGIGLHDPAAVFLHLVGEDQVEYAPTLVQDGAVEPSLLPNV